MAQPDPLELLGELPDQAAPAWVVDRVTRVFERLGKPADAAGVRRFMPGIDQTYGLRIPQLRALGEAVARRYRNDYHLCRSIARASWPRGTREHRMFAVFVAEQSALIPAERWALGLEFLPGVLTWEDCDQLCYATFAICLRLDAGYMDELERWIGDPNLWVRRAALVSTAPLRKAKHPLDVALDLDRRALGMCEKLLGDPEPYVQKAIDWAAREVINRHYHLARDWLLEQAGRDLPRHARSTLKLSAKKLEAADREAFGARVG